MNRNLSPQADPVQTVESNTATESEDPPVLWHLKVSNYNEKARWALDHKRVPHVRRPVVPGQHVKIAQRLSGTRTFPILELDGRPISDSTDIVAELERRWPDPPLYPCDPDERQRALELEDFFDEKLGPWARLLFLHHVLPDPKLMLGAFAPDLGAGRRLMARLSYRRIRRQVISQHDITAGRVDEGFEIIAAVGQRFRSELGRSGYLVGDSFTVADLTAAALIAPVVAPKQFPYPQPQRQHASVAPLRDALAQAGMLEWAEDMYARHRGTSAEVSTDEARETRRDNRPRAARS